MPERSDRTDHGRSSRPTPATDQLIIVLKEATAAERDMIAVIGIQNERVGGVQTELKENNVKLAAIQVSLNEIKTALTTMAGAQAREEAREEKAQAEWWNAGKEFIRSGPVQTVVKAFAAGLQTIITGLAMYAAMKLGILGDNAQKFVSDVASSPEAPP